MDAIDTRLFDLYIAECKEKDITPTMKDYMQWVKENGYA